MNTTSPPGSSKVDGARAAKCSSTLGRKAHDDEAGSEQWANQRRMSVLSGTENQSPQPEAELAGRMPGLPCPHLCVSQPRGHLRVMNTVEMAVFFISSLAVQGPEEACGEKPVARV